MCCLLLEPNINLHFVLQLKLENWEENPDRMLLDWVGINTNHNQRV